MLLLRALSKAEPSSAGQWDMAVALVLEFGLVPQVVYPESWNTSNSDALDGLLTSKLREMALDLQVYMRDKEKSMSQSALVRAARQVKSGMVRRVCSSVSRGGARLTAYWLQMKEIYRILTICCGTPPKPDQEVSSRVLPMTASFRHLGGADGDDPRSSRGSSRTKTRRRTRLSRRRENSLVCTQATTSVAPSLFSTTHAIRRSRPTRSSGSEMLSAVGRFATSTCPSSTSRRSRSR